MKQKAAYYATYYAIQDTTYNLAVGRETESMIDVAFTRAANERPAVSGCAVTKGLGSLWLLGLTGPRVSTSKTLEGFSGEGRLVRGRSHLVLTDIAHVPRRTGGKAHTSSVPDGRLFIPSRWAG